MNPLAEALTDMVWATLPLRNVLKGEARTKFMGVWARASKALCEERFKPDEAPLQHPREAAIRLHALCLTACEALGVRPHELVPQFNDAAEGGFVAQGDAADHIVRLGLAATSTARALVAAREEKETA